MNLEELKLELKSVLRDPTSEKSVTLWLNDEMGQLAYQYELPALKLKSPATLTTTAADHVYSMANDVTHTSGYTYQKHVWRVSLSATPETHLPLNRDIEAIDRIDPDHDETGSETTRIAIEDDSIMVYPLVANTLNLWFYRKPRPMVADENVPDGLSEEWHYRVLIPRVVLRAFRVYPDLATDDPSTNTRALALWTARLNEGLYGSRVTGAIGLIDSLRKSNPPRVRGAPRGMSVSGSDYYNRTGWN